MTLEQLIAPYALLAAILAAISYAMYSLYRRGWSEWRDYWPQVETLTILLIVYAACRGSYELYGRWDLFWQFGAIDVFSGVALWAVYHARWQRGVIGLFAAMSLVHIGYGSVLWVGIEAGQLAYNRMLNTLFYLQILMPVVATWLQNRRGQGRYVGLVLVDTASAWLFAPCGPSAHAKARG